MMMMMPATMMVLVMMPMIIPHNCLTTLAMALSVRWIVGLACFTSEIREGRLAAAPTTRKMLAGDEPWCARLARR